jgi:hypothetical protein
VRGAIFILVLSLPAQFMDLGLFPLQMSLAAEKEVESIDQQVKGVEVNGTGSYQSALGTNPNFKIRGKEEGK